MTNQGHYSRKPGSLEALLHRMGGDSDFPALSGVIGEINRIAASDTGSQEQLTNVILKDVAVTYKLIKLVNTVRYRQFGRNITTVSKAVVILGFDVVRDIAASLFLLNFLENKSQASNIKEEIVSAYLAGFVSTALSPPEYQGQAEELTICAMFSHLGKLLASSYFYEESQKIARLVKESSLTDEQAEVEVLGLSYSELGIGVAKRWGFPAAMIAGMRRLPEGNVGKPRFSADYLCATVNLSNELCHIVATVPYEDSDRALQKLCDRYRNALRVTKTDLLNALKNGLQELMDGSDIFEIDVAESALIKTALAWKIPDMEDDA